MICFDFGASERRAVARPRAVKRSSIRRSLLRGFVTSTAGSGVRGVEARGADVDNFSNVKAGKVIPHRSDRVETLRTFPDIVEL